MLFIMLNGCGVYSFTGATIDGKTLNFHNLENRSKNIVPSLTQILTDKIRTKIVTQTGLAATQATNADYDFTGAITNYDVTVSGVQNTQQAAQNRLTITIEMSFKNKKNEKQNFTQNFSRFSDFSASQTIESVQSKLIEEIGTQIAEDIFNKAFVNW